MRHKKRYSYKVGDLRIPAWMIETRKIFYDELEAKEYYSKLIKQYNPELIEFGCVRKEIIPEDREPKLENLCDTAKIWEYYSDNHRVEGKWVVLKRKDLSYLKKES